MFEYTITVKKDDSKSNHSRGYHSYETTVRFDYPDFNASHLDVRKEQEIVESIVGKRSNWMWYTIEQQAERSWVVSHGYDSGD